MTMVGDAVASGVVASLARPDANVTGVTFLLPQLSAKRLEIIKEVNPRISKVATLQNGANRIANDPVFRAMEAAATALRMDLLRFEVRGPNEFEAAFAAMVRGGAEAVVVSDDTLMSANPKAIADLAMKYRIASIGFTEFAEAGGLMAYGVSRSELFRRIAYFVDRVLKGAKTGDMPVELPTKFELIANIKTAMLLGLKVPTVVLIRADRVIE